MHVLLEGVLHLEVQLLLKHMVLVAGYLNSRIQSFAYSRKEAKSRPPKSLMP